MPVSIQSWPAQLGQIKARPNSDNSENDKQKLLTLRLGSLAWLLIFIKGSHKLISRQLTLVLPCFFVTFLHSSAGRKTRFRELNLLVGRPASTGSTLVKRL